MPAHQPVMADPKPISAVIAWLLDSDPAIRWQVREDLTDAPAAKVASGRSLRHRLRRTAAVWPPPTMAASSGESD